MARSDDNVLTHGLKGKVGDLLVFKCVNGKTIVSKVPSKSGREPSEKQAQVQEHFQEAVIYGKTVMVTPELKVLYETLVPEGKSVYQVALADFLNAPKIKEIDLNRYTGQAGSIISVRATDDFKVKSVEVSIFASNGNLVEQGQAAPEPNGFDWIYKAQVTNDGTSGDKIVVKASDLPGNTTSSTMQL